MNSQCIQEPFKGNQGEVMEGKVKDGPARWVQVTKLSISIF